MTATELPSTLVGWMREVRRLCGILGPSAHAEQDVALTHGVKREYDERRKQHVNKGEAWTASCPMGRETGLTPEQAMGGLLTKLQRDVEAKIAKARDNLRDLERAYGQGSARTVATERPS